MPVYNLIYGAIILFTFKLYNIHIYSLSIFLLTKLFATNSQESLAQTLYQWLSNPIFKTTSIAYVTEMLGNVIEGIRITFHYQNWHLLLYKLAEQFPSGLDRLLECHKWYISYNMGTWDLCVI